MTDGRCGLLLDQMVYVHERGGGWLPPLSKALDGLDAAQAAWQPLGSGGHSIWQLVNHLAFWKEVCTQAVTKGPRLPGPIINDATFGDRGDPSDDAAWRAGCARLLTANSALRAVVGELTEAGLEGHLPGEQTTVEELVSRLNIHDAYHLGQIVLTRRLREGKVPPPFPHPARRPSISVDGTSNARQGCAGATLRDSGQERDPRRGHSGGLSPDSLE